MAGKEFTSRSGHLAYLLVFLSYKSLKRRKRRMKKLLNKLESEISWKKTTTQFSRKYGKHCNRYFSEETWMFNKDAKKILTIVSIQENKNQDLWYCYTTSLIKKQNWQCHQHHCIDKCNGMKLSCTGDEAFKLLQPLLKATSLKSWKDAWPTIWQSTAQKMP